MARSQTGRWTHDHDGEGVVVFLVELSRGFLGARTLLGAGGPTVVQHWRRVEDLHAHAADPAAAHRPAWTSFNRRARSAAGPVGIWHETYVVPAGGHESVYVDMPPVGLAAAVGSRPVAPSRERAGDRLRASAGPRA